MANAAPVLFLVPGDPQQRTGGYRYVARLVEALNEQGVNARVQGLEGRFPVPDRVAEAAMDAALANCDEGAWVVLDGLAMGGLPAVVEKHAARLRLVALVHHPLADETGISAEDSRFLFASETRALAAVSAIITTSHPTAARLQDFNVAPETIQVIEPGADTVAAMGVGVRQVPASGELRILCVAGLSPRKAQHQLVQALGELQHLPWHCTLVGSTERNGPYSQQVAEQIQALSLSRRIRLAGEMGEADLAAAYRNADLFVLPSVYEGYGMVIDEALAAGLPVITTDGGALATTGNRPGVRQYAAGAVAELTDCLRAWLSDRSLLQELTRAAQTTGESARHWSAAAREFQNAMRRIPEMPNPELKDHSQFDQSWLLLREPADHRARNQALLAQLADWLEQRGGGPLRIVDLGAGAGSNGVYLSQKLSMAQHWILLDQDPGLLAKASARLAPNVARLEVCQCNLEVGKLAALIPAQTQLISASALIDLTSASWLEALAKTAKARDAAVYIVLSYAGQFQLSPEHEDDDFLRAQVNAHQHGDKGSGAALGPEATGYLQGQLEALGFSVSVAPSPWVLTGDARALQAALIAGWCEAAIEQNPAAKARIQQWQSARLHRAQQGALQIQVDHQDLLAVPVYD